MSTISQLVIISGSLHVKRNMSRMTIYDRVQTPMHMFRLSGLCVFQLKPALALRHLFSCTSRQRALSPAGARPDWHKMESAHAQRE
ncbi:hypothetical protein EVAR_88033_1 [Eumeta japonica]|uniref:Uncharacterized protein n=1 Tax=Eumeta variegata TaxID=151549 RepID=A0A4C1VCU2_EUMVA|nr:hypothetical protein EVAR_88033_1 [Eumeta japonica]